MLRLYLIHIMDKVFPYFQKSSASTYTNMYRIQYIFYCHHSSPQFWCPRFLMFCPHFDHLDLFPIIIIFPLLLICLLSSVRGIFLSLTSFISLKNELKIKYIFLLNHFHFIHSGSFINLLLIFSF